MPEPRDPLLKVVTILVYQNSTSFDAIKGSWLVPPAGRPAEEEGKVLVKEGGNAGPPPGKGLPPPGDGSRVGKGNDPSAGSPTETLLRLLLPLNDRV